MRNLLIVVVSCFIAGVLLCLGITQEIPVGAVEGTVTLQENGLTLSKKLVVLTPIDDPTSDNPRSREWHARTDSNGHFVIRSVPAGHYEVSIFARDHHLKPKTSVVVSEGQTEQIEAALIANDPYLTLEASEHVISPDTSVKIDASGFVRQNELQVEVRQIPIEAVVSKNGIDPFVGMLREDSAAGQQAFLAQTRSITRFTSPIVKDREGAIMTDDDGGTVQKIKIPPLKPGLYIVSCAAGSCKAYVFLNCSRLGMATKTSSTQTLCFVADLDSGKPIGGAQIMVANGGSIKPCATTDSQGIAKLTADQVGKKGFVLAKSADSFGMVQSADQDDSSGDDSEDTDPDARVFTYADRPVYRPGDTVHFKVLARHRDGDRMSIPARKGAKVTITDPDENTLQTQSYSLDQHGAFSGQFVSNSEAKPGVYAIHVNAAGGSDVYYANLAAYRKPDFTVTVRPVKPQYRTGDPIQATVSSEYYFGGPLVGATVNLEIYRTPAWRSAADDDDASDDSGSDDSGFQGGEYVGNVQGVTDAGGKAVLTYVPADSSVETTGQGHFDYTYSLRATVSESEEKSFDGTAAVLVTQGAYELTMSSSPWIVSVGDTSTITVSTDSNEPGHKPVAGRKVSLQIGSVTYVNNAEVFEPIQTVDLVTDATGKAEYELHQTEERQVRMNATSVDDQGRSIQCSDWIYVEGAPVGKEQTEQLGIHLDRKRYKPGDTATVLLTTGSPGGVALVTIEGDDVLWQKTIAMDERSKVIRIPVSKEYAPNAYVCGAYIKDSTFANVSKRLTVNRFDRKLNISVTPSTSKAKPGETVSFNIRTTNHNGKPVPADVSLGLVDESIYALKPDTTDIVTGLYPDVDNGVTTNYSFPEVYLDGGDKGGGNVAIRRNFQDTAAWMPTILTGPDGTAKVSVKLPDNLTTWRATVVGTTDDTEVGMSTGSTQASKPLMIRVLAAPYIVVGDQESAVASVTNDSGGPLDADLNVASSQLLANGKFGAEIHLDKDQTRAIPFEVSAKTSGSAKLVATIQAPSANDGVAQKMTVLPNGRLDTARFAGIAQPDATLSFDASDHRDLNDGEFRVTIGAGIGAGLIQSVDSLIAFPYGCVEQTMSRFLPAIEVDKTLQAGGYSSPAMSSKANSVATDGLTRLSTMQHGDGGWGWWQYDDSDPFMTGWVLDGLRRAKALGCPIPHSIRLQGAIDWATARLKKPEKFDSTTARLFLAYALAQYGVKDGPAELISRYDLSHAEVGEASIVALTAQELGDKQKAQDALKVVEEGWSHPRPVDDKLKWTDWWSQDEQQALMLQALVVCKPDDANLIDRVNRLLSRRGVDMWISTRATSLAIEALCDYIRIRPEALKPVDVNFTLNGKPHGHMALQAKPGEPIEQTLSIPVAELKNGHNDFEIKATSGQPTYAAELRQYVVEQPMAARPAGDALMVDRKYYRMEPTLTPDGSMKLLPSKQPVDRIRVGDIVQCQVTLKSKYDLKYLMIEDPVPANCRVTDREDIGDGDTWSFWWCSMVILDDRVSAFANSFDKGQSTFTYTMRAESGGACNALPTLVQAMYQPDIVATGPESQMTVDR